MVAALAFVSATAHAESITTRCYGDHYGRTCTTQVSPDPAPVVYTPEDLERMAKRDAKWGAFCQPREETGADGLTRWVYAHKDCDLGRSQ
jgi:hypothetical protein